VQGHLILTNCLTEEVTRPAIERAVKEDELLWLDLDDTGPDTIALLREVFKIHPLAIEDAQEFNQRPKVEDYDDFVSMVAYGAQGLDQPLAEVHAFYAEHFLVTVHREPVPAIDHACQALTRGIPTNRRLIALYRLFDALVDSMFPYLAALDDRIDELQDQIFDNPEKEQLAGLFAMKRQLVDMRKLVTPQRDMVSSMLAGVVLPGMTADTERYFRDLYDHLIRISDMVDSYRDLLSGSLDAYVSMVSNRMNQQMKQLTIIATIFLPLSYLTGFFGQNFAWLVTRIGSLPAFLGIGVGTEVLAVIGLLTLFKKQGWM
jgi:magnesium transporter